MRYSKPFYLPFSVHEIFGWFDTPCIYVNNTPNCDSYAKIIFNIYIFLCLPIHVYLYTYNYHVINCKSIYSQIRRIVDIMSFASAKYFLIDLEFGTNDTRSHLTSSKERSTTTKNKLTVRRNPGSCKARSACSPNRSPGN